MSLEFLNSSMCSEQARYYLLGENFHPKKKEGEQAGAELWSTLQA